MVTIGSLLFVLAAIPKVEGGTPDQKKRVQKAFESVPECIKSCDGDGKPMTLEIESDGEMNATYNYLTGEVTFHDGILPKKFDSVSKKEARSACQKSDAYKPFGNTNRVMLHELAHRFHMTCVTNDGGTKETNKDKLDAFLDLRWKEAKKKWDESTERQAVEDKIEPISDKAGELEAKFETAKEEYENAKKKLAAAKTKAEKKQAEREVAAAKKKTQAAYDELKKYVLSDDVKKAICEYQQGLQRIYDSLGMPSRYQYDRHAIDDEDGAEYFAMAVEMLVYDASGFCKSYKADEIAWLKEKLGACLDTLTKKADCYRESGNPVQQNGGKGGGRTLTK